MKITDEQKQRANEVNLPQFLMAHGFDLKRVGNSEYIWKEHDSLHIKDNNPGERGAWHRFSTNEGGDNIAFLRKYMGMSFVEAVEALNGEHYSNRAYTPSAPSHTEKHEQKIAREISLAENSDCKRLFAYLCKTRGLDYELVSSLVKSGVIAQEQKTGNVLFKFFDEQGKVIGAEKVGTSTEHKFKGIATGSADGRGFEVVRGSGEKAFFFESAIDMLSYLQMHNKELDNCRLVSMMGVKPNTVLSTMKRHNISPKNVFICSDNDKAGNEFAQKLLGQYLEMERVITNDRYKDWNDELRGIPKKDEAEKEKNLENKVDNKINKADNKISEKIYYGNKIWNNATDNKEKSIIIVSSSDFHKKKKMLEDSGHNYYAYENIQDGKVHIAVNEKDEKKLWKMLNDIDKRVTKSNIIYTPPEKNIIGNTKFYYISQKEYVRDNRDIILKMAELMEKQNIKFSGRIYPDGNGTLTVSRSDLNAVNAIKHEIETMREHFETLSPTDTKSEHIEKSVDSILTATSDISDEIREKAAESEPELTPMEQSFLKFDIAPVMAKSPLAWDEIEDIGYILFEKGYTDKYQGSEKAIYGNGLHEPELYDISRRMQNGEDVRRELSTALLGRQNSFTTDGGNTFTVTYNENDITAKFGNAEKSVSYEAVGDAFLSLIKGEYDSIVHDRTIEELRNTIPNLPDETAEKLITVFDGAALQGWEKGDNRPKLNRIKKALYDILGNEEQTEKAFASIADMKYNVKFETEKPDSLDFHFGSKEHDDEWISESEIVDAFAKEHPDCSFALANAVMEYLDEKQHSERNIKELHAGWYKKTDFTIHAVVGGEEFNYDGRFDIGDGKGTGGGSLIDHIRDYQQAIIDSESYPNNKPERKENARKTLDIFVPYLEKNSQLTDKEQDILHNFIKYNPIRDENYLKAQSFAKEQGIPFQKSYSDGIDDEPNIYAYSGDMSIEDFRKMQMLYEESAENQSLMSDVPKVEGEQLSLFGEKQEYANGLFVGGVNRFTALHDEIMQDTAFLADKRKRVQEFHQENNPTNREFADFLKKEYGTGGHSGDDDKIAVVDYDSSGIIFTVRDRNGSFSNPNEVGIEKFMFTWSDVAEFTSEIIERGEYFTEKEQTAKPKNVVEVEKTEPVGEVLEAKNIDSVLKAFAEEWCVNFEAVSYVANRYEYGDTEIQGLSNLKKAADFESYSANHSGVSKFKYHQAMKKALHDLLIDEIMPLRAENSQKINEKADSVPEKEVVSSENPQKDSFKITDDSLGEGGAKSKFQNNIAAITTLKQLEVENRPATAEEKETLSKYVGWGGLAQAFDKNNSAWSEEFTQLKELLTDKEYSSARASTLDAFYTSPAIIDGIYEALEKFGFEGGNVLEPALGVGNFIGRMPENMAENSKVYGTEIDNISGRIAQKLYPDADIKVEGFEKNSYQNGCFDVAVGNVPFGDLGFKDEKHGTSKLHDYFFAETLDKVKDGGIVAFVTSTGTLDKKDDSVRKQLAEKADFIGAIRLPSGAFKANAGTDVTSDIIFLQKRDTPQNETPDWVHIGETADGLPVNQYFADNPDMILGNLVEDTNPRSSGTKVVSIDGADLKEQISKAVSKLDAHIADERAADVYIMSKSSENKEVIPPEGLRNFSFFEQNNNIYFKTVNRSHEFRYNNSSSGYNRAKAFIKLRDTTRELLAAQEQNKSDDVIKALQNQLSRQYDSFYSNYGLINSAGNKRFFKEDVSYNLLTTLEKEHDGKNLIAKSDIFTKRTIMPARAVEHVDTALEALTLSISEKAKVDFDYMTSLTDIPKETLISQLKGEIFHVPFTNEYQEKSEYLSGDIRQKLNVAQQAAESYPEEFEENVAALKFAMPEPLKAADIEVKIGAEWIEPKYYEKFMYETFRTPYENRADNPSIKASKIEVKYSDTANSYLITNKSLDKSISSVRDYGTNKVTAYAIMECLLNLREPKITKLVDNPDNPDKSKRVVDVEATRLAQNKAEKIKESFKDWIFKDPERREQLVKTYNEKFNSICPREYDGSHLRFPNMSKDIQLQEHQKNAVAHALFGGNTLFAHSVGAGKTYEMIAAAMESKRLGLCTKSLMCVPNHLTEQIGRDFMKLYPNANILVASKNDFTKQNRQKLFSKIATGNFDAVIIGHSQLKMIPMSKERQEDILQSQINDITVGIEQYKSLKEDNTFSVKAMERSRKSLQKQLDNLRFQKQDDVITFEEMGIDKLILDEAHEFKNLFTPTKLQNVSGISNTASQKSLDLFQKCRYLDEKTGGKGVIMATGTPLSNSVTELHTMMRYLEYDFLKEKKLEHFDNWVTVFGEQKTDWELAPAGNQFKQRTRISNYTGLPELMSMFKQCADVRTADSLNLPVPECETHVVNVEATPFQKLLVQELADRADDVQDKKIDPTVDNMLRITSDGRKLGLDPRLIDPSYEDNPDTKLNQCVNNVFRIYEETEENKSTQIIFCDLGVPHKDSTKDSNNEKSSETDEKSIAELNSLEEECDFCVYEDIKKKLMSRGVNESEIAFIHDAKSEKQKSELFDKVKKGEVRVLLGSTSKMGTGTNVQDKLIAVHDLDIPWRPADMEQRKGRIERQGNENEKVHLYRYVTKGTFDAYSYQTLENKQKFISQIMTSKTPVRKCEDVDQQALSYSEIKALCTGDERIKEKMQLDNEVKELKLLKAEYTNTVYEMQDKIRSAPKQIDFLNRRLENLQKDKEHIQQLPIDNITGVPTFKISLNHRLFSDRKEAAKAFEEAAYRAVGSNSDKWIKIGEFQGFPLSVRMHGLTKNLQCELKGAENYVTDMGVSFSHNLKKLENVYRTDERIAETSDNLYRLKLDVQTAERIVSQPFPREDELNEKSSRLSELTDTLNREAVAAKKKNPNKQRTNYFDCAKLKKEAAKIRNQSKKTNVEKNTDNIAI